FLRAAPADGLAGTKIDDMRATAEGVEARTGTGQTILEPPEAGEVELLRKAQNEADDGFDIAVVVIVDPEGATLGRVLAHDVEACDLRVVGVLIGFAQALEQGERAGSVVGGANVEQAREMGEVIRHGDLLNGEDPAKWPGAMSGWGGGRERSAGRIVARRLSRGMYAEHLPVEALARCPEAANGA